MQAFDLADTLVHINYSAYSTAQLVQNIEKAKVIYHPTTPFEVITAQQDNPAIHSAISRMIKANFTGCRGVHVVSGSQAEVIKAKAETIKRIGATTFTDNNREILAGIKELVPEVKLYVMTTSGRRPY